jgi:hypothetical protein
VFGILLQAKRSFSNSSINDTLYDKDNFDIAILNTNSATEGQLWMNFGYWKNTSTFPQACQNMAKMVAEFGHFVPQDKILGNDLTTFVTSYYL